MDIEQTACHSFEYTLDPADFQRSFAVCNRKRFFSGRLNLIGGILVLMGGILIPDQSSIPLLWGVILAVLGILILRALKQQKANLPTCTSSYRWELYETELAVSVYRDGALSTYVRRDYTEIVHSWRYDDRYALHLGNSLYILPVSAVPKNSPLHTAITRKLEVHKNKTNLEKWGVGLFWGSIASLFLSAWAALLLPELLGGRGMQYMFLMWVAIPIPIACLVLGFVLKKRGFAWKKNVICGIVIAALLLLFGSYTFIFEPLDENAEAFIGRVEQEVGIDFPDFSFSDVTSHVISSPGNDNIFTLNRYYASFSSFEQKDMKHLLSNSRWLQEVPYKLLPCIPLNSINADADYFLLYDATTGIFNAIPTSPGVHTLFYITYSSQYGSLEIVEYEFICN